MPNAGSVVDQNPSSLGFYHLDFFWEVMYFGRMGLTLIRIED